MTVRGPRYSNEEFARRGQEVYERVVRPALKPEDKDKFVAIEIESGDYELDPDERAACDRLYARHADPQIIVLRRVGHPAAVYLGGRPNRRAGQ
ncbi:MAG: hypothetical protein U0797_11570 [Gemmataceae bacterium]